MTDAEEREMDDYIAQHAIGPVVSCDDEPELRRFEGLLCEVLTYTYQVL